MVEMGRVKTSDFFDWSNRLAVLTNGDLCREADGIKEDPGAPKRADGSKNRFIE